MFIIFDIILNSDVPKQNTNPSRDVKKTKQNEDNSHSEQPTCSSYQTYSEIQYELDKMLEEATALRKDIGVVLKDTFDESSKRK